MDGADSYKRMSGNGRDRQPVWVRCPSSHTIEYCHCPFTVKLVMAFFICGNGKKQLQTDVLLHRFCFLRFWSADMLCYALRICKDWKESKNCRQQVCADQKCPVHG